MNPKDFFEVHHYRLIEPTESVPSLVSDNTKALNNKTVTLSSLK